MPLVSVIIPTYNRASVLPRAIKSVLGQTFSDFELLVVDDGSDDSTADILETFEGKLKPLFQENRGVAAARNLGIKCSTGPFLAFLDSDDEWLPEKLARQTDLIDAANPDFICHTDELWLRNGIEVPQKGIHCKQGGRFFPRALERCLISPSSVMVSRILLDRVGWFDEGLPAAEDYDLWLRVTAFHDVGFVPDRLVIKHGGREDQLSHLTPAIDRFRISAILKILENPSLCDVYREAAIRELIRKCHVVASGCMKRGKKEEAETYIETALRYQNHSF